MREHDGSRVSSPDGGDGADPSPPRSDWSRRLSAAAAIALVGLRSLTGSATAAPSTPVGQWVNAGATVNLDAGWSCVLGGCPTTWLSDREDAAVEVVCADGSKILKVRGYFGQGEDVLTGRTSAQNVRIVGWTPPSCGPFDEEATFRRNPTTPDYPNGGGAPF
jgi:hypothetical protein